MKINKLIILIFFSLLVCLSGCKNPFRYTDAREVPVDAKERVKKNIEEGRGFRLSTDKSKGGVFDFASSNELWRASIEVLDFVSFTNASYSGGIIITDWFSGNSKNKSSLRELKITVRFLSNEIRADGIEVIIHEKLCDKVETEKCKINKIKSEIGNEIKLAILKKAAFLKKQTTKKKKK
tara:strand:+ start:592 stop:1131 length:540 start_codon:yes stop_codon:yes gene_type:complete